MAKAIATITGTALAPGVSRNKRLYTKEAIGKMVARATERIAAGTRPIAMYTSHDSMDVADIGGVITRVWQEDDGSARYTADIPDTPTGRAVAGLVDNRGGSQFLRGVSVFGNWVGRQRHERGPGGALLETGDDFELGRLDFTSSPGVDAAGIDTLQAAIGDGEALAQYAIAESAPEALVTAITEDAGDQPVAESAAEGVTETAPAAPEGAREALAALLGPVTEALPNTVAMSKRKSGMSGSGRKYADPGYQADKKQRYDITDKAHAVAAWRYINQASKAAKYSAAQLKNIKSRIRAALKSFGVTAAAEGWVLEPAYQVSEAVAEWLGDDPKRSGSWCINASNGPVSLSISSYCMDPADLDVILKAAADAACGAFKTLDPDMDGDVDVPGVGDGSDTDGDAGHETAPQDPATQATEATEGAPAPQAGPAEDASPEQEGVSAVPDTDTNQAVAAESAPATITQADLDKAVAEAAQTAAAAAVEAYDAKRREAKAAKWAAATESAPAAPAPQSAPAVPVTETQEQRDARIIATALKAVGYQPPVQETEEEKVARLVKEGVTEFIQEAVATGAVIPGRAGLQVREHATDPDEAPDGKALAAMSDDEFKAYGGANLDAYMGQNTRIQALHT